MNRKLYTTCVLDFISLLRAQCRSSVGEPMNEVSTPLVSNYNSNFTTMQMVATHRAAPQCSGMERVWTSRIGKGIHSGTVYMCLDSEALAEPDTRRHKLISNLTFVTCASPGIGILIIIRQILSCRRHMKRFPGEFLPHHINNTKRSLPTQFRWLLFHSITI